MTKECHLILWWTKGQRISKGLLVSSNSPKKRMNEFVFTSTMNSFICFLGEFEDTRSLSKIIWPLVFQFFYPQSLKNLNKETNTYILTLWSHKKNLTRKWDTVIKYCVLVSWDNSFIAPANALFYIVFQFFHP